MSENPALNGRPVILVHLERPRGSGLTACSGQRFTPAADFEWPTVPRVACVGCNWPHGVHNVKPRSGSTEEEEQT